MNVEKETDNLDVPSPFLSVIIPAYNEANRIPYTLEKIFNYLDSKDFSWEILVVDDGSKDETVEISKNFLEKFPNAKVIQNERNRGKGFSVKRGMMQSKGEYRLFTDSDLSTPIEEMDRFLEYHEKGYDICIGSRSLPDSNVEIHQPWYREKMGKIFGVLQGILLLKNIVDSQCGFKSFSRRAAEYTFPKQLVEGFCFDVELLYIAQKNRFTICEIPVTWRNNPETKVGALKDSSKMFLDLLRIRLNGLKGLYY